MRQQSKRIAIVGHACKVAGANDPNALWDNILGQKSHITPGPNNRDYLIKYWQARTNQEGSTDLYGGFVDDVSTFDHNFFSIPRPVANFMDPQQRVALELTQSCLEDAAIPPSLVAGQNVGVYFAAFNHDYKELIDASSASIEAHYSTGTAAASIPGRVSNHYDFRGPSVLVDAACSGSLHALHLAIQGLEYGDCNMAVVGAVNYILTPTRHLSFEKMGMLSPSGVSYAFDSRANGYVRSEGAVVLLIKYLDDAIRDGDHIHSVIAGSAISHTGRSRTLTRPVPEAQASAIVLAHERADFSVETIGSFQAHGTATPVGDPMEVVGILESFETLALRQRKDPPVGYCALESAKVHVGHAEATAGLVGVVATTMSMKHQTLPALMNFKKLNPSITLENTPFYIPDQNTIWEPMSGDDGSRIPLRAGVSSHGFTGANAHVAMEQAPDPVDLSDAAVKEERKQHPAYLVALSAKTENALGQQRSKLLSWLGQPQSSKSLVDISATTLVGRDHYQYREVYLCESLEDLKAKLLDPPGSGEREGYFRSPAQTRRPTGAEQRKGKEARRLTVLVEELAAGRSLTREEYRSKLAALAEAYSLGINVDWRTFFSGRPYKRISMPGTVFAKTRCWFKDPTSSAVGDSRYAGYLHPLLQVNTSTLREQRFTSLFAGNEPFLYEGRGELIGQKILPELAALEMIREAVVRSHPAFDRDAVGERTIRLTNISWENPITVESRPIIIHVGVIPEARSEPGNTKCTFEVYGEAATEGYLVHCSGDVIAEKNPPQADQIALDRLRETIPGYRQHDHAGDLLRFDGSRGLARLTSATEKDHQRLQVAALGAAQHLITSVVHPSSRPVDLHSMLIYEPCPRKPWLFVHSKDTQPDSNGFATLDVCFADEQGKVCIKLNGLRVLRTQKENWPDNQRARETTNMNNFILFSPCWKEEHDRIPNMSRGHATDYDRHVVVALHLEPGAAEELKREVGRTLNEVQHYYFPDCNDQKPSERYVTYSAALLETIQKLLDEVSEQDGTALLQLLVQEGGDEELLLGLLGMLKTANLEDPQFVGQLICISPDMSVPTIVEKLHENSCFPGDQCIRYSEGERYVQKWKEIGHWSSQGKEDLRETPWKDGGVYIITGGYGALGLIFAREIAERVKAPTLILTGRRDIPFDDSKLEALRDLGAIVDYQRIDVSHERQVKVLIQHVNERYGEVQGVIHGAGVIQDSFITNKTSGELHNVMTPKVSGLINLDIATRDQPLDFIICFSSVAGSLGNIGQADYAAANAFCDAYASFRNKVTGKGQRRGRFMSMNWPLWKNGGMSMDDATKEAMIEDLGIVPMGTDVGLQAFYHAWASGESQVMVLEGDLPRIRNYLQQNQESEGGAPVSDEMTDQSTLHERLEASITRIVSESLEQDAADIAPDVPLSELGVDSALMTGIATTLRKVYDVKITAAKLFRYPTIAKLTKFLMDKHEDKVVRHLNVAEGRSESTNAAGSGPDEASPAVEVHSGHYTSADRTVQRPRYRERFYVADRTDFDSVGGTSLDEPYEKSSVQVPLAIIGRSCRAAQSEGPDELWENIKAGKDCTHEVPIGRWGEIEDEKMVRERGGFVKDADKFDAKFFGILPREARGMDPQQRLALEYAWKAIEDAGYSAKRLAGSDTAVFIGVSPTDYACPINGGPHDGYTAANRSPAIVAGRISKTLDFHGPCSAMDTACSASLIALARAAEVIRSGRSRMALIGGVHLNVIPDSFEIRDTAGMLSKDRRCKAFSNRADGFGPGEGVGMVLVKKLSDALKDGDHIYAVVRAVYDNHGGDVGSLTAPNPEAQADLLEAAYKQAGLDPVRVDYLEAHGTGTEIGDPIEFDAATEAFERFGEKNEGDRRKGYCALGSLKSNIGHTEPASGVLSLIKLTLQLEHKTLAPTINCEEVNPQIDVEDSPFYIPRAAQHWRAQIGPDGRELTRIAAASAFGFGGSNVHVIVEEHRRETDTSRKSTNDGGEPPYVIIVSAKSSDRLLAKAKDLVEHIAKKAYTDNDLNNIAYVLQVGRDAMPVRLAIVANSIDDLRQSLLSFIEGKDQCDNLYTSSGDDKPKHSKSLAKDAESTRKVDEFLAAGELAEIAKLWVAGAEFDWQRLYNDGQPRRVPLPTYPFAGKSYWHPKGVPTNQF